MSTPQILPLQPLMRAELSAAKLWLRLAGVIQLFALIVALVPLFHATATTQVLAAIAAFGTPVALFFIRQQAGPHQLKGERLRRFHLLHDALGRLPPKDDLADLVAGRTSLPSLDPAPAGGYFSSTLPPGLPRLVDNLQESAFYTKETSSTAARLYGGLALVGLLLVGGLVYYWLHTYFGALDTKTTDYAQIFATLVVFFGVGHLADGSGSFHELAREADTVYREAMRLRSEPAASLDAHDVHSVLARYDCAVLRAPPIPGLIYRMRQERLDETWRGIFGTTDS